MANMEEKKRAYEERKSHETMSGNLTVVHPVEVVTLGKALVVVAGNKVYFVAGLWNRVSREEVQGANEGGFAGRQ